MPEHVALAPVLPNLTFARHAVAVALERVFGRGERVAKIWDEGLTGGNARFAQDLLEHCLRSWGRLQAYAKPELHPSNGEVPLETQIILAMAFAESAWMGGLGAPAAREPASASASHGAESAADPERHAALLNDLLRRAAKDPETLASDLAKLPPAMDRTPFTERLLEKALAPFGLVGSKESLWSRLMAPHLPSYRAVVPGTEPQGLAVDAKVTGCLALEKGGLPPRGWLSSGGGMVQDRSIQAFLNFQWDGPVHQILDVCAAPGGKTTNLALRFPEALFFAVEFNNRRARRLQETITLRGLRGRMAEMVVQDAELWMRQSKHEFDLVLVDAPCSGTGKYQEHPDLGWVGSKIDLAALGALQRKLLEAALLRLAPGGLLLYGVCSWLPEECAEHLAWVLQAHPDFLPARVWPAGMGVDPGSTNFFRPNPLTWEGEGFQGFALMKR